MDFKNWLDNPETRSLLLTGLALIILTTIFFKKIKKARKKKEEHEKETAKVKEDNQILSREIRSRIINDVNNLSRIIGLNPVIPGNTPESATLESRNRAKCLAMIIEALPHDTKSQGIRMAELTHQLSDNLIQAYGKEGVVNVLIDVQAVILDVDSAVSVTLVLNELISNALQYAPVPGEKSKVNIIFKERGHKLFISVGDNGIGMKSPYIPKFSFGLQLVNILVQKHKGEMIITSRPGTRVEITLSEYQKSEREVYVTPTTRVY